MTIIDFGSPLPGAGTVTWGDEHVADVLRGTDGYKIWCRVGTCKAALASFQSLRRHLKNVHKREVPHLTWKRF